MLCPTHHILHVMSSLTMFIVQIVFPLFTISIIATAMFPILSISLLTMSPCVFFHVFHSTCLLVSPSNVPFQCLLVSPLHVCNASFKVSSNDQCALSSLFQFISNTSIHASSNQSPTSLQPVSNSSLQMS